MRNGEIIQERSKLIALEYKLTPDYNPYFTSTLISHFIFHIKMINNLAKLINYLQTLLSPFVPSLLGDKGRLMAPPV